MQKHLSELEKERDKLKGELTQTPQHSNKLENTHSQEDVDKLMNLLAFYKTKYEDAKNAKDETNWQEEYKVLVKQLESVKALKTAVDQQLLSLQGHFKNQEQELVRLAQEKSQWKTHWENSQHELGQTRSALNEAKLFGQSLSASKDNIEAANQNLCDELNTTKEFLAQAKNLIVQLREELQNLTQRHAELEEKNLQVEQNASGKESQLQASLEHYQEIEAEQNQRLEKLSHELYEKDMAIRELQNLEFADKQQIEQLTQEKIQWQAHWETSHNELEQVKNALAEVKLAGQLLSDDREKIEAANKELCDELNTNKEFLLQAKNTIGQLRNELQSLTQRNAELEEKSLQAEQNSSSKESQLQASLELYQEVEIKQNQRLEKLSHELYEKERTIQELLDLEFTYKQQIEQLTQEKAQWQAHWETSHNELEQVKDALHEAKLAGLLLSNTRESIEAANKELCDELKTNKDFLLQAKNTIGQLRNELQTLVKRNGELEQKNLQTEQMVAVTEAQLQASLEHYREVELKQNQRLEKLALELHEKDRKIHELQDFEFSYKKQIEQKKDWENQLETAWGNNQALHLEIEEKQQQLAESKLRSEQLEKGIQYLRGKLDEANTDKNLLEEELLSNQQLIGQLSEELDAVKAEHESTLEQFTAFNEQHYELQEEANSLRSQFEQLRNLIKSGQEALEEKNHQYKEAQDNVVRLTIEKESCFKELEERRQYLGRLKGEISELRDEIRASVDELKELEGMYLSSIDEKMVVSTNLQEAQRIGKEQKEELNSLAEIKRNLEIRLREEERVVLEQKQQLERLQHVEHEKNQLSERALVLEQETEHLGSLIEEISREKSEVESRLNKNKELLRDRDQALESKISQILLLTQEGQRLQENLQRMQTHIEEKEAQTSKAQQHLAKKVKECTVLQEKIDETKSHIADLYAQIQTAQAKIAENRQLAEASQQQEKRLQELLNETMKTHELTYSNKEEKYLKLYDQLQTVEARNKELATRNNKLQAMVSSFLTVEDSSQLEQEPVIAPQATPAPLNPVESVAAPVVKEENWLKNPVKEPVNIAKSEPKDLFGDTFSNPKHKQHLFDDF